MKMAKATKEDINALMKLMTTLEQRCDETEPGYKEYDDVAIARWIRQAFRSNSVRTGWRRVIYGCDILIDTVCDPDKGYLDYSPALKQYLPETKNELGERLFYIISYKHSHKGILSFWCANDKGYTRDLKYAGKYTESQVLAQMDYYHNGESSVAVSVEEFHDGRYKICQRVDTNPAEKAKLQKRAQLKVLDLLDEKEEVSK